MEGVFDLLYSGFNLKKHKYDSEVWRLVVYPYFEAHGPYWEKRLLKDNIGKNVLIGQGVEQEHARREIEKLKKLKGSALANALKGARDFALYNGEMWRALRDKIKSI
ncbi:MAG TPA: hypothetical protein VG826_35230 [Pirellulales bacterium]|nr:hypothetical protein [Pirellulales bacterium]